MYSGTVVPATDHAQGNLPEKSHNNRNQGSDVPDHQVQSNVRLNEINPQAFRHFRKNNPLIEQEYWEKTQNGLIVRYKDSDKYEPGLLR